mgnify:CR=1 FL=1
MEPYPAAFRGQMGAEGYLKSDYLSLLGGGVIGLIIKQLIGIEPLYRLPAPLLVFFYLLFLLR